MAARAAPTINHWTNDEVARILADAEALAKAGGLADVGTTELIAREAGPAIISYGESNGYGHIVMGTGDKRGGVAAGSGLGRGRGGRSCALHGDHCAVTIAR